MTTPLLIVVVEWLVFKLPLVQNMITHSQKKSEKLKAVVSGHQELAAKDKCISEELTKNCYLQRELDMLKQERTRETWLLKNDLRNLEKANSELKEQKKAHQGKPLLPPSTFP
jgi:small-conductance mechanosensitive channel